MTDQQRALAALPAELQADIELVCQVAEALPVHNGAAIDAAAALVVAHRDRQAR